MNSPALGLRVAGTIFALVCLGQLLRLVARIDVVFNGHHIPLWPSALAFLMAGGLSLWLWSLSYKTGERSTPTVGQPRGTTNP